MHLLSYSWNRIPLLYRSFSYSYVLIPSTIVLAWIFLPNLCPLLATTIGSIVMDKNIQDCSSNICFCKYLHVVQLCSCVRYDFSIQWHQSKDFLFLLYTVNTCTWFSWIHKVFHFDKLSRAYTPKPFSIVNCALNVHIISLAICCSSVFCHFLISFLQGVAMLYL